MQPVAIDIVIIGRNEGELLAKAIQSSIAAAQEFTLLGNPKPNIIYIDGQSSDRSLEIASQFGIEYSIVEGKPNPALGRHIGFKHCNGKYVFFLDGDMEIYPKWLPAGIKYLEEHLDIAGTAGFCDWEVYHGATVTKIPNYSGIKSYGQKVTDDVGGTFLYRSVVLRSIGDFDPTMVRVEELDLYFRIIAGGYNLTYLNVPMVIHRDMKGSMGWNFIKRSLFTKNVFIYGVIARKTHKNRKVLRLLFNRYWMFVWHVLSVAWILISLFFSFGTADKVFWLTFAILGTVQLFLTHYLYKGRNIKRAFVSLFAINIYIPAFIFGYIFCWPNVGGYYAENKNVS